MQSRSLLTLFLGLFLFFPVCNVGFCFSLTTGSHRSGLPCLRRSAEPDRVPCAAGGGRALVRRRAEPGCCGGEAWGLQRNPLPRPATHGLRWEGTDPGRPRLPAGVGGRPAAPSGSGSLAPAQPAPLPAAPAREQRPRPLWGPLCSSRSGTQPRARGHLNPRG